MNTVVLVGRLTKKPETQYSKTENPIQIARFTLAVDRAYKKQGQPIVDFIRCVAFGKTAEVAEKYLDKGTKVGVTGRIQAGSYKAQDGRTVYTMDVLADSIEFMTSRAENAAQSVTEQFETVTEEELPFD